MTGAGDAAADPGGRGVDEARRGIEDRLAALGAAGEALRSRPGSEVADALAAACARFADPADPARAGAVAALAAHHDASPGAIERILDAAFPRWDREAIDRWVAADLGDPGALDGFVEIGSAGRRARGPRLLVSIQARGVPTTPVADAMAGLLVRAATWIKPAAGADDLAARFAAALREVDPGVGAALLVESFEPGSPAACDALAAADLVAATGGAETMEAIRRAVDPATRVVLHGPRLSAAAIGREALEAPSEALAALADDAALAGQVGCLSPVVAWVEAEPPEVHALARPLLDALSARWPGRPRTDADPGERARWAEWTALAGVEAAAGTGGPTAGGVEDGWTVRTRSRADAPDPPPVPRAIVLEPVGSLEAVAALCARRRGTVSTVGVAAAPDRIRALAPDLAAAGVERVTELGSMQRPPLGWRRDGRPELADLVSWTDRETG